MKTPVKVGLIALSLMFLIILFPGKYWNREFNPECNTYCNDISSNLLDLQRSLECNPPVDGFSVSCIGISKQTSCEKSKKCFSQCGNICFGIVIGTGAVPNPIEAKLNFINTGN